MSVINNIFFLIEKNLKLKVIYLFFLTLIGTFLETLGVGIILPVLTLIVQGKEALQEMLNKIPFLIDEKINLAKYTDSDLIVYSIGLIILIFFLKTIFFIFLIWRQNQFAYLVDSSLSKRLFSFYLSKNYLFHAQRNSSELFRNIIDEVKSFRHFVITSSLTLFIEILVLVSIASLIIFLQPIPAIVAAVSIAICLMIFSKINKKRLSKIGKDRQYHDALKIQHLNQGLNGIKEIKLSSKENEFSFIFNKHNLISIKSTAEHQFWISIPKYVLEFIGVFVFMVIAIFITKKGFDLKVFLPTIGLIAAATFRLLPSANRIIQSINNIRFGLPSANTLSNELKITKTKIIQEKLNNKLPINFEKLNFENISFCYPNSENNIIENVNFEISKGDKIGILGPSGSGKSTLIDVVTGLLQPTSGRIKLNNLNVNLAQKDWYKKIGYVSQFIFLIDDSIKKNIAFGIEDNKINPDLINKSINFAELTEFVHNSIHGIDTKIGEFGARISGGQRQRIGIARAIYSNSEILVLDEATSAVDLQTEEKIIKNINSLSKKTIIIISHRMSTIKDCNKIFEIKNNNLRQIK